MCCVGCSQQLATDVLDDLTWSRLDIAVDPAGKKVSATDNGIVLGSQTLAIRPAYSCFEGVGVLDNFRLCRAP